MSATDELSGFFERFGSAYRWFVITTTLMGTITVVLSSTIVNVALPDIMGAFGIGQDQAQWMSTGFLAAMTASMLVNAWLNDAIGIRATFVGSMALFAAASVLGGLAPNENVLTFARVAQGIAAGIIQPLAMIMIFRVFPPEERGTAMGIYGIGVVLAPAVGPVLGGWLIDNYDWRYVFYMGLPTSFLGMLLGTIFLPTRLSGGKRRRFDSFGFVLLAAFLVTSLYALANGQREGWNSDIIVGTGALSLALFLSFIVWLARRAEPLVSLRVFAFRRYSAASLVAFLYGAGLYGSTYLIPLFLQTVQGYTPTRSGLLLMPAGLVLGLVFPIAGRLTDRLPAYLLVCAGLFLFGLSNLLLYEIDVDTPFWDMALMVLLGRIGLGVMMPALNAGALSALPAELLAQGTGTINFMRQLGGAFGVSLLSAAVEIRFAFHSAALTATQTEANSTTMYVIQLIEQINAMAGVPAAYVYQVGGALNFLDKVLAAKAQSMAYSDGFAIVGIVFLLSLLPGYLMKGRR